MSYLEAEMAGMRDRVSALERKMFELGHPRESKIKEKLDIPHPLPWDRDKKMRHVVIDASGCHIFACLHDNDAVMAVDAANALMHQPERQVALIPAINWREFSNWLGEHYSGLSANVREQMFDAWNTSRASCDVLVWRDAEKDRIPDNVEVLAEHPVGYFVAKGHSVEFIRWAELPKRK